jgi:hypothetical protein
MGTAYVSFVKPINHDTISSLLHACRAILCESDEQSGQRLEVSDFFLHW